MLENDRRPCIRVIGRAPNRWRPVPKCWYPSKLPFDIFSKIFAISQNQSIVIKNANRRHVTLACIVGENYQLIFDGFITDEKYRFLNVANNQAVSLTLQIDDRIGATRTDYDKHIINTQRFTNADGRSTPKRNNGEPPRTKSDLRLRQAFCGSIPDDRLAAKRIININLKAASFCSKG
uniref:Uncharacterized protein n=1 Tax=Romanomermis culicivorax TaxID=13658 RepID=A0A915JI46_ROMCU